VNFETELLVQSYRLIYRFIYHGGKIWMNRKIQQRVKWLYHRYGMTREEIIEYVKWQFKARGKNRNFDPEKSCLETYVLNFTYFTLLSLVRQCKNFDAGGKHDIPPFQASDHEPIQTMGSSIDSYERQEIDGLIDPESPEDALVGKELMEIAARYFGEEDLAVIIAIKDKRAEARRLGLNYETYRKRLQRKISSFRSILKDNGYE